MNSVETTEPSKRSLFKQKFGVSKTTYQNMVKNGLITSPDDINQIIKNRLKEIRKARKKAIDKIKGRKHEDSVNWRRYKGKPRKRRDGKLRGSVKSGSRTPKA